MMMMENNDSDTSPPQGDDVPPAPAPPTDSEGLYERYDVILCGTGLVQSILAAALARAGQRILHCDGNDHYGEYDAVVSRSFEWKQPPPEQQENTTTTTTTHPQQQQQQEKDDSTIPLCAGTRFLDVSSDTLTRIPLQVGTQVSTPYGIGRIFSLSPLQIHLEHWILANGSSPMLYVGQSEEEEEESPSSSSSSRSTLLIPTLLAQTRSLLQQRFALDVTPALLFASGPAVEGLLTSGVSEYLEFKSLEGLLWMERDGGSSSSLERVPCSKADVFSSALLSPLDKRKLMKFLQLTLDYATAATAVQVSSTRTEDASFSSSSSHHVEQDNMKTDSTAPPATDTTTTLDSIHKQQQQQQQPQRHATAAAAAGEEQVQFLNEYHLNQGRSLARPQNKAVSAQDLEGLQSSLTSDFSTYLTERAKLSPKLRALVLHALALQSSSSSSSSSNTTTMTTETAMRRLCQHVQALGRFGTTAFLVPLYGSGELAQAFCRSAAVHGGTYLLRRPAKRVLLESNKNGGRVQGIVLGPDGDGDDDKAAAEEERGVGVGQQQEAEMNRGEKRICSRHVVVPRHALLQGYDSVSQRRLARRISIIQGKVLPEYNEQRHVVILPPDLVGNDHVIHATVLDSGVHVAPPGCTVLHLTTVVDDSDDDAKCKSVLDDAIALWKVHEIYHVSFSIPIPAESQNPSPCIDGLHLCGFTGQSLVADDAFEQARTIFESICPGQEFLALSEQMDAVIQQRVRNDDSDEEQVVLESAMNMMEIANHQSSDGSTQATKGADGHEQQELVGTEPES